MWKRRLLISSAAIALAVVACTDTPTATDAVDGLAFGKPDNSGVVTRFTVITFLTMTDFDNDLRATVGFDREGWCDAGLGTGDAFVDHLEFIKEHDVQQTIRRNGEGTDIRVWDGILVVYNSLGSIRDCGLPLVGIGTGNTRFRFVSLRGDGVDISLDNFNGFIFTEDGSRKRVNAALTHLDGVRMNPDAVFHEFNTRIIVR